MAPLLLDACCKAGGSAEGYRRAGWQPIGVDKDPQPNYPFPFVQMDALECLERLLDALPVHVRLNPTDPSTSALYLSHFEGIHASFPCQFASRKTRNPENHPDLITPGRPLLEQTLLPYVMENVEGAPLLDPIAAVRLELRSAGPAPQAVRDELPAARRRRATTRGQDARQAVRGVATTASWFMSGFVPRLRHRRRQGRRALGRRRWASTG
jgi:hypothetical protein